MSNVLNPKLAFLTPGSYFLQSRVSRQRSSPAQACWKATLPDDANTQRAARKRPYGYWKKPENIHAELLKFIHDHSQAAVMPTQSELIEAGRSDLAGAIRRYGSWKKVADELGLVLSSIVKPRSLNLTFCTDLKLRSGGMRPYMYWRDFDNLRTELVHVLEAMRQDEECELCEGVLPSASQFEGIGRSDVVRAIRIHGGWNEVAKRLNLSSSSHAKEYWADFSNVEAEIRRIIQENASSSRRKVMPQLTKLYECGSPGLYNAVVRRFGGSARVAKRMGLETAKKPNGYWTLANIKKELELSLLEICNLNSARDPSVMPTKTELKSVGRSDVYSAIERMGGKHSIALKVGLRCEVEPPRRRNKGSPSNLNQGARKDR